MTLPTLRYPLDPTGTNPDNFVSGEIRDLPNLSIRATVPTYAPFFADSVVIYDVATGIQVTHATSYRCVELVKEPTIQFGKEICAVILITDPAISNQISVSYQVLGGAYQLDPTNLVERYVNSLSATGPVYFPDILEKPTFWPPTLHPHLFEDLRGAGALIAALEHIEKAILMGSLPTLDAVINYIDTRIEGVNSAIMGLITGHARQQQLDINSLIHENKLPEDYTESVTNLTEMVVKLMNKQLDYETRITALEDSNR